MGYGAVGPRTLSKELRLLQNDIREKKLNFKPFSLLGQSSKSNGCLHIAILSKDLDLDLDLDYLRNQKPIQN